MTGKGEEGGGVSKQENRRFGKHDYKVRFPALIMPLLCPLSKLKMAKMYVLPLSAGVKLA